MYDHESWYEYDEDPADETDGNDDETFAFEARWRGSGEFELVVSREGVMPLQSLPDFTLPVGIAAVIFVLFVLTRGGPTAKVIQPVLEVAASGSIVEEPVLQVVPPDSPDPPDPNVFAAPYTDYVITQGVHGASYGHMAIDLAAGKGAAILSPINGVIRDKLTDRYGNPTLVIENERFVVTLLHGIYSVEVGEIVTIGQQVGVESNLGYTTDMRGVPCVQKTGYCGYHSHLNVFDKSLDSNVNPLDLIR